MAFRHLTAIVLTSLLIQFILPLPASAGGSKRYEDPAGAFRFEHPSRWIARSLPEGNGMFLTVDQGYVSIMLTPGARAPLPLLKQMAGQILPQWSDTRTLNEGTWQHRNAPAAFLDMEGKNPKGLRARLQIMALVAHGTGYVLLCSAPVDEFPRMKQGWDHLIESFETSKGHAKARTHATTTAKPTGTRALAHERTSPPRTTKNEGPVAMGREGGMYRHPLGFSFWYPKGWQIKELEDSLQFVPPDPAMMQGGLAEFYFIIGDSADGIARPDDPRIGQYLESKLRAILPDVRQQRGPSRVSMAHGQGAGYTWSGRTAQGIVLEARAYACLLRNYGIALVGIGLPKHLNRRRPALEAMFASFSLGQGQVDRALVGTWNFLKNSALHNDSVWLDSWEKASMASESKSQLVLDAGGRWQRTYSSYMIAGAGGLWLENNERKVTKGHWNAGNGILYLVHDDQTWESYPYRLKTTQGGETLALRAEKKVSTWKRAR